MRAIIMALGLAAALFSTESANAQDVRVRGYTRSDGTYVAPHVRSAPDSSRANNYGPSRSSPGYRGLYTAPNTRDHDRDGIANRYDSDDDNDGSHDNADASQYGRLTSGLNSLFAPNRK